MGLAQRQQKRVTELREAMREDVAMLRTIIHGKTEKEKEEKMIGVKDWYRMVIFLITIVTAVCIFLTNPGSWAGFISWMIALMLVPFAFRKAT